MMAVDDQFHRLPVHVPRNSLLDGTRFPGTLEGMCQVKSHCIAYHGVVNPVGQQHPALVLGHTQHLLLLHQFDGKRFLGESFRGVSAKTDSTQRSGNIQCTIGIVDGQLVVLYPLGSLVAHHEIHKLVDYSDTGSYGTEVTRCRLLYHHHRQTGVGDAHHIVTLHAVGLYRVGYGLCEIHLCHSAGLLYSSHTHGSTLAGCEGGHQMEVIEIGNHEAHLAAAYRSRIGAHAVELRLVSAVPHELVVKQLARILLHRESKLAE